jgi:hypothetical protein
MRRPLKEWIGATLPYGRGSVNASIASGTFLSRARKHAVCRGKRISPSEYKPKTPDAAL